MSELKRRSIERKHTLVKKRFWQWLVKKMDLTVFWDLKKIIIIDLLEKSTTVNSASYCQLFGNISLYLLNDPHISNQANLGTLTHS